MHVSPNYTPHPSDIDTSDHFWNAFDHAETEVSARWLVRLCQRDGNGWQPFSIQDIETFYAVKYSHGFKFNRLISEGWIVEGRDGLLHFTDDFVDRCARGRPL